MFKYINLLSWVLFILLGAIGGHYHGKAQTLERFVSPEIECKLGINPITAERLN